MRALHTTLAAAALAAAVAVAPVKDAKADGGVVVGVGAYLVVDYVVGRKCHMHHWPFNLAKKVIHGLHGKPVCRYKRHRKHHH